VNKRCYFCGRTKTLEKHHIIPRNIVPRNGGKKYQKTIPVCERCHDQLHFLLDPVIDYLMLYIQKMAEKLAEKKIANPIGFVRTNHLKGGKRNERHK